MAMLRIVGSVCKNHASKMNPIFLPTMFKTVSHREMCRNLLMADRILCVKSSIHPGINSLVCFSTTSIYCDGINDSRKSYSRFGHKTKPQTIIDKIRYTFFICSLLFFSLGYYTKFFTFLGMRNAIDFNKDYSIYNEPFEKWKDQQDKKITGSKFQVKASSTEEVEGTNATVNVSNEENNNKKKKQKVSFKARKIIEYENRLRQYSTPDKIFRYFATLKVKCDGEWEVFMTPQDFVRSLTPGVMQPQEYGLDSFKKFDPQKDGMEIDYHVGKDSTFYRLGQSGLISFSDYIFLLTILSTPPRNFQIAFQMFDLNGDGEVDYEEFSKVQDVLANHTSVGIRHRDRSVTGNVNKGMSSSLNAFFFGTDSQKKLTSKEFLNFQKQLQREILQIEYNRYVQDDGKISEREFCRMLLTYAELPDKKRSRMLKRVRRKFKENPQGITFDDYLSFWMFLKSINDVDTALSFYHLAGVSIDMETFRHVAKTVAHVELSDYVIEVVFTLFDENNDGQLSNKEFVNVMKRKLMRGLEKPKDTGFVKLLNAMWKCGKNQTSAFLE